MPTFDSVIVGESWISEHYLTSDARSGTFFAEVLRLRARWDEEETEEVRTSRSGLREAALALANAFVKLAESTDDEDARGVHQQVRAALLLDREPTTWSSDRSGDEIRVPECIEHPTPTGTALLMLEAAPVQAVEDLLDPDSGRLLSPATVDGKPQSAVAKTISAIFLTDDAPPFVLVQAGGMMLLAERSRWAEGRWLAVDLAVVADRRDRKRAGELEHAAAMVGRDLLLPEDDGTARWLTLLDESVQHTVGVSADLRDGVRLSVELIANEVVARRHRQGLPVYDVPDLARDLTRQSLRFLYRILFLLYAEASPQLEVLPVQAPEYQAGYGLDRLRELVLVKLSSEQARNGTHLFDSLSLLFHLVDKGPKARASDAGPADDDALVFHPLRADLFADGAIKLIDEVGLGNAALQLVLEHLLLTKPKRGGDRGFISYAQLGINQLGAVYEGLMSWTGFVADTDLYEVARGGDPGGGTWLLPAERVHDVPDDSFVRTTDERTGESRPVLHRRGTFVYRLAGRERQQSASYYTPEVLTRSVVHHALAELLDQDGTVTNARDILELTICEPALGSGAFAIEAVRQLAAEYLRRRQDELGVRIPAEDYPAELQRVKAYLALHQVYGVDLNATAVELAEVSLWLDTMQAGLAAPWYGLHLRRGNSLIGARRAVYDPSYLNGTTWLTTVPRDVPLRDPSDFNATPDVDDGIHHFLLPAAGWGAVADTPETRTYAPEGRDRLRSWRTEILRAPNRAQRGRLARLAERVEVLWGLTRRRLEVAEAGIRRTASVWGGGSVKSADEPVTREQVEVVLNDEDSAYRRLRRLMDAWCALWYWPITTDAEPPGWDAWLDGLEALAGKGVRETAAERAGQVSFAADLSWRQLDDAELLDRQFAGSQSVAGALANHQWLAVSDEIAKEQGFYHWELDFAQVFARGGFDLQVGNPPWVRPAWDEAGVLAEYDPWWQLAANASERDRAARRLSTLALPGAREWFLDERTEQAATNAHLGSAVDRPLLHGLQPDLYRCFMDRTWRSASPTGIVSLIHPESHFTELRAGGLREEAYRRLRRHWGFKNNMYVFSEISDKRGFGVHVYGAQRPARFMHAAWIYQPDVVDRSMVHDGTGPEPGVRDDNDHWDVRPHRSRIVLVDESVLRRWAALLDVPGTPPERARMLSPVNQSSASVLNKLADAPRFGDLPFEWTRGWEEDRDRRLGLIVRSPAVPSTWSDVILQGPHLFVANPFFQEPNESARNRADYSVLDLESLSEGFVPRTTYQRAVPYPKFEASYPHWDDLPSNGFFRLAWRKRVDPATERSLQAALIIPGPTHLHQVQSLSTANPVDLVVACGIWSAITSDFFVKAAGVADVTVGVFTKLPHLRGHPLEPELLLRTLRLNCLVRPYAPLWSRLFSADWLVDRWVPGVGVPYAGRAEIGAVTPEWSTDSPLRRASDRRQALVEIDAIVAVMLGLSADELSAIYRTQFPVLQGYERVALYDRFGRQVPADVARHYRRALVAGRPPMALESPERNFVAPFSGVDREPDLRAAHAHFADIAAARSAATT